LIKRLLLGAPCAGSAFCFQFQAQRLQYNAKEVFEAAKKSIAKHFYSSNKVYAKGVVITK
tara:strand:- start:1167 stop:1346 length:180 start_codon:yes stop_codon:yes gene_type:complete